MEFKPLAIFGVFPVKLRGLAFITLDKWTQGKNIEGELGLPLFESVNKSRSIEGQKPTFDFLEWEQTGIL